MSVGFIRSNAVRKLVSVVCLLTFPAVAQQTNTGLAMQATPAVGERDAERKPAAGSVDAKHGQQSATPGGQSESGKAPLPEAPHVKDLPQPTHHGLFQTGASAAEPICALHPTRCTAAIVYERSKNRTADPERQADAVIE